MFVIDQSRPDLGGNLRHGDVASFTPKLWNFITQRFAVRSILDVGCGEGHAVAYFNSVGIRAHGIDGLRTNVLRAVTPVAQHDLTTGSYFMPVDMVMCVEVVEHIQEKYIDNLLQTLANGRIVMMTHAVPGQSGHHHVNEQNSEYWVDAFTKLGYVLCRENNILRNIAKSEGYTTFFAQSGHLFVRVR